VKPLPRRRRAAAVEVKPDVSLVIRIQVIKLTLDLLVELDLTERPAYNREKLLAYDSLLCGCSAITDRPG
jgi:hypothetical protein